MYILRYEASPNMYWRRLSILIANDHDVSYSVQILMQIFSPTDQHLFNGIPYSRISSSLRCANGILHTRTAFDNALNCCMDTCEIVKLSIRNIFAFAEYDKV
jgi:hypothetical protein